jgi:hypothetical protein
MLSLRLTHLTALVSLLALVAGSALPLPANNLQLEDRQISCYDNCQNLGDTCQKCCVSNHHPARAFLLARKAVEETS